MTAGTGETSTAGAGARTEKTEARIRVDAGRTLGELLRPWTTFGYDELNWTYTPRGKRALATFGEFAERPYYVRAHNLLTSGRGFSWPHWGSGNAYHEDAAGNPYYEWSIVDQVFDAYCEAGHKPLVELGFTPRALVPEGTELPFTRSPSQYGTYEAYEWSFPPKDFGKWRELMYQLARHCVDRYGAEEVASWYWELWNEPDISYWRGTVEQYCDLYEHTVEGLTRALPSIKVGGPSVTGGQRAVAFMETFLAHVVSRGTRLDFITFHTKGSAFGRSYAPVGNDGARFQWGEGETKGWVARKSPSRKKMLTEIRAHLRAAGKHPQLRGVPCIVDECDPCVPAHFSRYDDPNFGFRNTSYYPTIMASVFKRLMDLNEALPEAPDVTLATSWSFYFEGERFFEGFREFFTAENVELPVLNGYRLLGKLGSQRLALSSDASWEIGRLDALPGPGGSGGTSFDPSGATAAQGGAGAGDSLADHEVDGLAAREGDRIAVAVWHHVDDQYATLPPAAVTVEVSNLPFDAARARVRHWRIDDSHSNAHTVWQEMGRPQDPTEAQLRALKARQGLEEGPAVTAEPDGAGGLRLRLELPLHAISLLEVEPG